MSEARTGPVLATLSGIIFLRVAGVSLVLSGFVAYGASLGGSVFESGLAFSAYPLMLAAMLFPFSALSDRVGRRAVLVGGLALAAFGGLVAAAATSVPLLALGRGLQGAGAVNGVALATAGELGPADRRARRMAVLGAAAGGGFAVGLILGALLEPLVGIRGILLLHSAASLLLIIPVLRTIPARVPRIEAPALGASVLTRPILLLGGGAFAVNFSLTGLLFLSPLLLASLAPDVPYVLLLTIMVLPGGLGIFVTSRLADMGHERRVGLGAAALLGLGPVAFVLGVSPGVIVLVLAGILYFVGHSALTALIPSLVSANAQEGRRGASQGVQSTLQSIGSAAGSAVVAALYPHDPALAAAFLLAGLVAAVAILLTASARKTPTDAAPVASSL